MSTQSRGSSDKRFIVLLLTVDALTWGIVYLTTESVNIASITVSVINIVISIVFVILSIVNLNKAARSLERMRDY